MTLGIKVSIETMLKVKNRTKRTKDRNRRKVNYLFRVSLRLMGLILNKKKFLMLKLPVGFQY